MAIGIWVKLAVLKRDGVEVAKQQVKAAPPDSIVKSNTTTPTVHIDVKPEVLAGSRAKARPAAQPIVASLFLSSISRGAGTSDDSKLLSLPSTPGRVVLSFDLDDSTNGSFWAVLSRAGGREVRMFHETVPAIAAKHSDEDDTRHFDPIKTTPDRPRRVQLSFESKLLHPGDYTLVLYSSPNRSTENMLGVIRSP